jgi:hypothetical protein
MQRASRKFAFVVSARSDGGRERGREDEREREREREREIEVWPVWLDTIEKLLFELLHALQLCLERVHLTVDHRLLLLDSIHVCTSDCGPGRPLWGEERRGSELCLLGDGVCGLRESGGRGGGEEEVKEWWVVKGKRRGEERRGEERRGEEKTEKGSEKKVRRSGCERGERRKEAWQQRTAAAPKVSSVTAFLMAMGS